MSERITEADLQAAEAAVGLDDRDENPMPERLTAGWRHGDDIGPQDPTIRALVAEVRRLRALILAVVASGGYSRRDSDWTEEWFALEREAEALAEEATTGPK